MHCRDTLTAQVTAPSRRPLLSDARDAGLELDLEPDLEPVLLPRLRPPSPLVRLTKMVGGWVETISNFSSTLLFVREESVCLLVLGWGDSTGNTGTVLCEDTSPAAEDEEPSLANATGISSKDSAESEWYSVGGPAAWTGAKGGSEALRGNAGKGSR